MGRVKEMWINEIDKVFETLDEAIANHPESTMSFAREAVDSLVRLGYTKEEAEAEIYLSIDL